MQQKLLTLCIDTKPGCSRLSECLDSIVIAARASHTDVLVLLDETDEAAETLLQGYIERYPDIIRTQPYNSGLTFVEQSAKLALGKYLRPLGSDCIIEPNGLDLLLRFLSDTDDDLVIHGCTVTDDSTGIKEGYNAPLGLMGRGTPVEKAAPLICNVPSQSAVVKTELINRCGAIGNRRNDYAEFFINGLMQAITVGGVDADLCRFTAPVSLVQTDASQLEHTIFTLTDLFNVYSSSPESKTAAINCIAYRIAQLAVARLGLWLSLPNDSEVCHQIYAFFSKLRRANRRVYERFVDDKYAKKLKLGRFMYSSTARLYRKKEN